MHSPFKVAALGLVALAAIAGTSTLTTAYLMRPPVAATAPEAEEAAPSPPRAAIVRIAPVPRHHAPPCAATPGAVGAGLGAGAGAGNSGRGSCGTALGGTPGRGRDGR